MDEFLFQNATMGAAEAASDPASAGARMPKWAEQVWDKMDNSERLELARLKASAPPFGRRSQRNPGFGRRTVAPAALAPSHRAQIREMQAQLADFVKR